MTTLNGCRSYGPPTAVKGDIRRRRAFDELVLEVLAEHHPRPLPVSEVNKLVKRRWKGQRGPGGVPGALDRLRRAGDAVTVSRGGFREWRATEGR